MQKVTEKAASKESVKSVLKTGEKKTNIDKKYFLYERLYIMANVLEQKG